MDGEGTICISRDKLQGHKKLISHTLYVSCVNTDKDIIYWLKELFGGCVVVLHKNRQNSNWRQAYQWAIKSNKAVPFLKAIAPYLRLKRFQAEIGLEFQARKRNVIENKEWVKSKTKGGHTLSETEITHREDVWKRMKELNHHPVTSVIIK